MSFVCVKALIDHEYPVGIPRMVDEQYDIPEGSVAENAIAKGWVAYAGCAAPDPVQSSPVCVAAVVDHDYPPGVRRTAGSTYQLPEGSIAQNALAKGLVDYDQCATGPVGPPAMMVTTPSGNTTTPAVLTLSGDFTPSMDAVGLAVYLIGAAGNLLIIDTLTPTSTTAAQAATEFAAMLMANPTNAGNFNCVAVGATIEIRATGANTTVLIDRPQVEANYVNPSVTVTQAAGDQTTPATITFTGTFPDTATLNIPATSTPSGAANFSGAGGAYPEAGGPYLDNAFLSGEVYIGTFLWSEDPDNEGSGFVSYTGNGNVMEIRSVAPETAVALGAVSITV
jgi:hypothetical protein